MRGTWRQFAPAELREKPQIGALFARTRGDARASAFCGKMKSWKADPMAHRTTLEAERAAKPAKAAKKSANGAERERVFEAFRRWGYLQADLDPLGFLKPLASSDLDFSGEIADEARRIYCGT